MLEDRLLKGICIKWRIPSPIIAPADGAFHVTRPAPTPLIYDGLAGAREAMDPALLMRPPSSFGLTKGRNLQYKWLDYRPGGTAQTPLGGSDILTGKMSGCPIVMWTDAAGVCQVGHLGTMDGQDAINNKVKATAKRELPINASGFSPANAWNLGEMTTAIGHASRNMPNLPGGGGFAVIALVTTTRKFFSIALYSYGAQDHVVLGCREIPPLNRGQLMTLLQRV